MSPVTVTDEVRAPRVVDDPAVTRLIQRADAYRLFSAAFCTPSDMWREERLFSKLSDLLEAVHPGIGLVAGSLAMAYEGADLGELKVEAARLFVGPFELAVPPYGSCYLDQGRRVMGDSTMAVQSFYRDWGLELASDAAEVPDHIAIELEFIHVLLRRQAQALQQGDTKEADALGHACREFAGRWFLPFVRALTSRLKERAEMPFYRLLAEALQLFVKAEGDAREPSSA